MSTPFLFSPWRKSFIGSNADVKFVLYWDSHGSREGLRGGKMLLSEGAPKIMLSELLIVLKSKLSAWHKPRPVWSYYTSFCLLFLYGMLFAPLVFVFVYMSLKCTSVLFSLASFYKKKISCEHAFGLHCS